MENQTKQNVNDNNVTSDNKSADNVSVNKDNGLEAATYSSQSNDSNESNNEAKQGNVLLIAIIGITVIVICIAYVLIMTRKKSIRMNKVKHAVKPVNNGPRYKRVAALMITICMAVIPWITYMKVVKLDSTASEYFQNSDGLSVDFSCIIKH